MSSVQPASTMAEGFALAIAATALAGATSRIGRFPPRVSASQTSLASSATTRTGPDNAMADTPPYKIRRATYPTPRKGRVKGLRTVFRGELSGRSLLWRFFGENPQPPKNWGPCGAPPPRGGAGRG